MTDRYVSKTYPRRNSKRQRLESHIYHNGPLTTGEVAREFKITKRQVGGRLASSPEVIVCDRLQMQNYNREPQWAHLKTYSLSDLRDLYFAKGTDKRSMKKIRRFISKHPDLEAIMDIVGDTSFDDPFDRAPHRPQPTPDPFVGAEEE